MKKQTGYTIRKAGDNFALCFNGQRVESGLFATRETAKKYLQIAENERRARLNDAASREVTA